MTDSPGCLGPPTGGSDRLVRVVDDEADLLQIVSDRLVAAGYRVLTARDGIEALARAREARPGCIILDLKDAAARGLRGPAGAPAGGARRPRDRADRVSQPSPPRRVHDACRARGADALIRKPFDPGEFLRLAARAFDRD
jgi:CheY-like chemotaxis protein